MLRTRFGARRVVRPLAAAVLVVVASSRPLHAQQVASAVIAPRHDVDSGVVRAAELERSRRANADTIAALNARIAAASRRQVAEVAPLVARESAPAAPSAVLPVLVARLDSLEASQRVVAREIAALTHRAFPNSRDEAHTQPISADRPGFIETTSMLLPGQVQTELSGSVDHFAESTSTWSEPSMLRVGVTDRFELRVRGNGELTISEPDGKISGLSDFGVGAAWHLNDEHDGAPSSALVAYLNVPSGSRQTRGLSLSPSAFVPLSWTLAGDRNFAVMPGVSAQNEGDGFYVSGALAGAIAQELGEHAMVFVEAAGESLRSAAHGGSVVTATLGTALRIGLRDQIDAGVSQRLTATGPRVRAFIGWSLRIRD